MRRTINLVQHLLLSALENLPESERTLPLVGSFTEHSEFVFITVACGDLAQMIKITLSMKILIRNYHFTLSTHD